ncbi:MAG: hypothetical protein U1D30_21445 [Planctomycetota bacterium]
MKKYVIAALVFINAGLLSTIYMVLQQTPATESKTEKPSPPSAKVDTAPANAPKSDRGPEPPIVIPNIFEAGGILHATEQEGNGTGSKEPPGLFPASSKTTTKLRREGTKVDQLPGTVRRQGNRFEFQPADGSGALVLLENQLLQRIDYVQDRQPNAAAVRWKVSGVVTEYLGENYLLLEWLAMEMP